MKLLRMLFPAVLLVGMCWGCSLQCQRTEDIQVTLLVDISDERLLEAAKEDIQKNLGAFMARQGLSSLDECQQLTVNMAPLSARDELKLASETLSLTDKGLSARDRRERANPKPVIEMINRQFMSYDSLKDLPAYGKGSSIGNQILKAIHQTQGATSSYVIVFSDMVQHDEYISFYRSIPKEITASNMRMLFDPVVLDSWPGTAEGTQVIIVHLQQVDSSMKGRRREIAALWTNAIAQGLGLDVVVVDNLTQ